MLSVEEEVDLTRPPLHRVPVGLGHVQHGGLGAELLGQPRVTEAVQA
jgi:hypothetical protein